MADQKVFLRYASPNEQRTISREDAGLYYSVIVGVTYSFGDGLDVSCPKSFYYPLQRCIEEHPYLSVVVGDKHTDEAFYQRVPTVHLDDHIHMYDCPERINDLGAIEKLLAAYLDLPYAHNIPPWRIVVLQLNSGCFVAFTFSHTIGDGPTGTAFHRTFVDALMHDVQGQSPLATIQTPSKQLPPPFDTSETLPITWSFLLAPLISLVLPRFISKALGLRTSAASIDAGTWIGSRISFDPHQTHSRVKVHEINAARLRQIRTAARNQQAQLTATFHQIIVRALSKAIDNPKVTNFLSQTAINMRCAIGISNDEMGDFVSVRYFAHPRKDSGGEFSEADWARASFETSELAKSASILLDQPIGLLRYLPSIRQWTLSKIGHERDCSFEVSNIGSYVDHGIGAKPSGRVLKQVFAQPGHIISAPLAFNLAGVDNGSFVYTVTWRKGALGVPEEEEEDMVDRICLYINQDLESLN